MTVTVAKVSQKELSKIVGALTTLTDIEQKTFGKYLLASSSMWTGFYNDELVCCWGLVSPTLISDQAYLWLYTTPALAGREFMFVRHSQIEIRKMLEKHPKITGYATVGADSSIKWLRWLGADFSGEPQGNFIPFSIRKR